MKRVSIIVSIVSAIIAAIDKILDASFPNAPIFYKTIINIIFYGSLIAFIIAILYIVVSTSMAFKRNNFIPIISKNKKGILFDVDFQYIEGQEFFNHSFFNDFKKELESVSDELEIFQIPSKLSTRLQKYDKESQRRFFQRHNITLYLKYNIKTEGRKTAPNHEFIITDVKALDNSPDIENQLINLLNTLVEPIRKCLFDEERHLEKIDEYNKDLNLICHYIVGTCYLLHKDYQKAKKSFKNTSGLLTSWHYVKSTYYNLVNKTIVLCWYISLLQFKKSYYNDVTSYIANFSTADELMSELDDTRKITGHELAEYYTIKARHLFIKMSIDKSLDKDKTFSSIKQLNNKARSELTRLKLNSFAQDINDVFFAAYEQYSAELILKKIDKLLNKPESQHFNYVNIIGFVEDIRQYYNNYYFSLLLAEYYRFISSKSLDQSRECYRYFLNRCNKVDKKILLARLTNLNIVI